MSLFKKAVPLLFLLPLLPLVAALGACSSTKPGFQDDQLFSSTASPFLRNFDFPATDACEAARRGLLSQGYMTTMTHTDGVDATKDFQPAPDSHVDVEVHVVCTAGDASNTSVVYVNAVQNGYALKKSDTSASVGLSIFGSLSLPIRTNSDAMVKISSQTIQSGQFYEKFFDLVSRYLRTSARSEPVPHGAIEVTPLPPPVSPSPPIAVVTPSPASATAVPKPNDAHAAMPVANVATAASAPAVDTTASVQATTAAATDVVAAATSVGIGEPPLLTAPANYKLATVQVPSSAPAASLQSVAVQPAAMHTSVTQTAALPASNTPAATPHAAAPAPASGATNTAAVAATAAAGSTAAAAAPAAQ